MTITKEMTAHIAGLAKVGLTEAETARLTGELDSIVLFAAKLAELDTEGVAPTTHGVLIQSALREDREIQPPPRETMLANAPEHDEFCFLTPKVLE